MKNKLLYSLFALYMGVASSLAYSKPESRYPDKNVKIEGKTKYVKSEVYDTLESVVDVSKKGEKEFDLTVKDTWPFVVISDLKQNDPHAEIGFNHFPDPVIDIPSTLESIEFYLADYSLNAGLKSAGFFELVDGNEKIIHKKDYNGSLKNREERITLNWEYGEKKLRVRLTDITGHELVADYKFRLPPKPQTPTPLPTLTPIPTSTLTPTPKPEERALNNEYFKSVKLIHFEDNSELYAQFSLREKAKFKEGHLVLREANSNKSIKIELSSYLLEHEWDGTAYISILDHVLFEGTDVNKNIIPGKHKLSITLKDYDGNTIKEPLGTLNFGYDKKISSE